MDIRVPMAPIVAAFGLDIQVTRPAPDDTPVPTTGVWIPPPLEETRPVGTDFQRREPRKILAVPRTTTLPNAPRGSIVLAPEAAGAAILTWKVDGYDKPVEPDLMRLIVVRSSEA
jgi:hypothetical protein